MNKKIIISLISFAFIFVLSTPVFATNEIYFIEDFSSFSVGDSNAELVATDNWNSVPNGSYIVNSNNNIVRKNTSSILAQMYSKSFGNQSELYFYLTIIHPYEQGSNSYYYNGVIFRSNSYYDYRGIFFKRDIALDVMTFYDFNDSAYNYSADSNVTEFNLKLYINASTKKHSLWVNNDLVIDNVSFSSNRTSVDSFKILSAPPMMPYPNQTTQLYDIEYSNIAVTNYDSSPFVVNGTCGSANNSSFSVFPSDNLCSSGVICSGQPYTDGTYYYWTCYGYGPGATSEDCRASVLVPTAQCGYLANTQYIDSSPPSGSNACLSGSVRDMLQLDDDSWLWYCEVSDDDFVPCFTFSDNPIVITPSLPSSPDIACEDILTGQGFANCVSSVFAWLFLPHQDTIDEFFQLSSLMKTKIPFGYVYSFRDEINNLTSNSPSDFSVALTFNGDDQVPVVNSDTFDVLGSDFKSTYFRFIRAILWISFGVWVFNLGRKLFLDNRDN